MLKLCNIFPLKRDAVYIIMDAIGRDCVPYYIGESFSVILQIALFLIGVFYLGVGLFSLFSAREKSGTENRFCFAVVIPAHNEARVLPGLLTSLKNQDYPAECFSVFVMADNCTDQTARIAQRFGAIPLFRKTGSSSNKGAALADAFSQIMEREDFDAFAVFDADNFADSRFLTEINDAMQRGAFAVQGYIDAKNFQNSWVSCAYAIWYWISNRVLQMGFDRLGLGCSFAGTGFALTKELLCEIPWETDSLAEDAEYTLKLELAGKKVAYAQKAVAYDEKPSSFSASMMQRVRWAQGITQVQRDWGGKLLCRGKLGVFLRFWSNLLMPLCFMLFLVMDVFAVLQLCGLTEVRFISLWIHPFPFILLNFYLLGTLFVILIGLVQDKKWNRKVLLNVFGFLLYLVSWIPIGMLGALRHTKKNWYHTEHKPDM